MLTLNTADVRRTLEKVNAQKAAGPDNIPGRVLKECADQLAPVLTDIFNISLDQAVVPSCFKTAIIIPVPKKSTIKCFNDYRPVALTPIMAIMMKCFERLVKDYIFSRLPPMFDPFQFAYRPNRSTEDAISSVLHLSRDCRARFSTNHVVKYADDTTVVGLIQEDNEQAYREEVRQLVD